MNTSQDKAESLSAESLSIGTKIRNARMARQLSVKETTKQNHVSEQFINALEKDQYLKLPAKIYAISLAEDVLEYLNFTSEEKTNILEKLEEELNKVEQEKYELLKNENYTPKTSKFFFDNKFKKHQSPPPEKIEKNEPPHSSEWTLEMPTQEKATSSTLVKAMWLTLAFMGMLIVFVLLWFFVIQPKGLAIETLEKESYKKRLQVFSLYSKAQTLEMGEGDQLRIFFSNTITVLSLKSITDENLSFSASSGSNYLFELHDRHFVNLDDNEENDILLKYQKRSGDLAVVFVENLLFNENQVNYEKIWNNQEHVLIGRNYTLLENQIKVPIIVYVKALTLPVHLSYNVDGRRQNTVNLPPGTSLVISADEHLELQIGNYLSSALIINHTPINLFLEEYNRYSTTKIIKWLANYDNETLFDLVITDYVN